MNQTVALIGAPTSAGAHSAGLEQTPAVFRIAGLVQALDDHCVAVNDLGDLPVERWQSNLRPHGAGMVNNSDRVVHVAREVASRVTHAVNQGHFPLVIGGDCTITVGAFAGLIAGGLDPSLVYIDGGWDMSTPDLYPAGMMDSMGLAHLLDRPGSTELARIGTRTPLLTEDRLVEVGHSDGVTDGPEEAVVAELKLQSVPATAVQHNVAAAVADALGMIPEDAPFLVHFDIDVTNFFDFPVADVPQYRSGLTYADAIGTLEGFVGHPRCAGLVVTEFNSDHASPGNEEAVRLISDLARILETRA